MDWKGIEERWQGEWERRRVFEADPDLNKTKFFITVAYPYPNSPQHVGHGRTFTLTDVYARYKRMRGFNVLFPMAFHYTGTPILAMAKRVASGDEELIGEFTRLYGVPPEVVKEFVRPIRIADYFHREIRQGMKEIGYSIDWRREFTTIDPAYSRFIEWQFQKLRSKGLITRGSHPVGWCPSCGSPMGQHDTRGDVEPEIGEYVVIKFAIDGAYLPTATLRPETVFGVTNIWVRPDADYVRARVDGEVWIVSRECADKLPLLNREVSVIETVSGRELLGRYVENPVTGGMVPILPASFVDPKNATGVVMSVPGHAPYDYIALEDLRRNPTELSRFGVRTTILEDVRPISIIALEGYSEFPAADALRRLGAKNQLDPKVEEATREVYALEYHRGLMKGNTGAYAGMAVPQARERITEDLIRGRRGETVYELLNRPVFCRCGAELVVNIFEDQWFIDYDNPDWKRLAHHCLENMKIVPEGMREEFRNIIEWLKKKACARKHGLGTRLPWDPDWIIESLSDSVIYMSYYTIAKHIKEQNLDAERLDGGVFDCVLLGEGDPEIVGESVGIDAETLEGMREEFLYFYPLDSRDSGRDLVPNHLTFFIFNHASIFPRELWPRQIVVNGSVLMEGKKMSKSFGNIIPLRDAIQTYGADPFRIAVISTAELLQDADFSSTLAKAVKERLERFYASATEVIGMGFEGGETPVRPIDRWMLSRLQQRIKAVTEAMEGLQIREAVHHVLYMLDRDVQRYLRRTSVDPSHRGSVARVLREVLEARVLMLAPLVPHLCEEIWHQMGKGGFVSTAQWPSYDEARVDLRVIEEEELVRAVQDDTSSIIRATKLRPRRIFYYTCTRWKWRAYMRALETARRGSISLDDLMKEVRAYPDVLAEAELVDALVRKIVGDVNRMSKDDVERRLALGALDEARVIRDATDFLGKEFDSEVSCYGEDDTEKYDPEGRAGLAEPYRPAIYIE